MVTPASRLALDPHTRFRRFENEGVIINQTSAEALVVNDVAARLLEVSDGTRTIRDCMKLIASEFDGQPEEIERDLLRFAAELVEAGIARVVAA